MHDRRLPPRRTCDLHPSGMLRTVELLFRTDVSGNHIGPIFKSHTVQEGTAWPLKMGPKAGPETSVKKYESSLLKFPKEGRSQS